MGPGPARLPDNLIKGVDLPKVDLGGQPKEKPGYGGAHPNTAPGGRVLAHGQGILVPQLGCLREVHMV